LHPEPFGEHKMLNKLIQGGAAGIMKAAIVKTHALLSNPMMQMESRIISVVHDELQIDGPVHEVAKLHVAVPLEMRHAEMHKVVPVEVEHEVTTTNWAEKIDYDEWRAA
jgi:DNA polymerase I-like protein with 3'-5' exonuclease and polymerase domains